jgi:hypothetical protein
VSIICVDKIVKYTRRLLTIFLSTLMVLSGLRVVVVASSTVALCIHSGLWGVKC